MRKWCAVSLCVFTVIGCTKGSTSSTTTASSTAASSTKRPATGSASEDALALMQTSRDWSRVAASGDVDRILSYWTDDAIVLQPNQPALQGKKEIRGMVASSFKIPKFAISWEPERAWVSGNGDVGYLIEHNHVTFADSTGTMKNSYGKAVTIWKKDASGNWKCAVYTWNDNQTSMVLSVLP